MGNFWEILRNFWGNYGGFCGGIVGYLAVSDAVGLFANSDTFRAVFSLTSFVGALDFTFGFLALHVANCVSGFLATGVASRGSMKLKIILLGTRRRGRRLQGTWDRRISTRIGDGSGAPPVVSMRKSIMLKQIGLLVTSLLKITIIINFIYKFFLFRI